MERFSTCLIFVLNILLIPSQHYCMLAQSFCYTSASLTFSSSRISGTYSKVGRKRRSLTASSKDESDAWLDKAAKLRKEVRELEADTANTRRNVDSNPIMAPASQYADVANSVWTLSYRFSDQPESEDDDARRRFFGGKLTVKFRPDGYTDLISQEVIGSATEACKISKAWGWDVELSKDNENGGDKEYLLFSVDVDLPPATLNDKPSKQRFYFQARQEKDARTGLLSFAEGTVTMKQDVVQKSIRWGFFSPGGILAQFRYVGDFVAKPVARN